MSARHDDGTTQRRSIRPARPFADGREPPACLVVLQGQRLGQRIDIGDQPLVIGRAPECEFQILERSVSRQHSKIWREPSGYRVKDLDSTNKTFLNDQPIIEAELKDGDHITIGSCVLKFMDRSSVEARYHEEIYQLATVDPLTDLYNRRQFLELLEKELARAANHRRPLALLIIDIDHFKAINDRYGHPAGDVVLKRVARAVSAHAREEFIIARIGGEEFAAVLPEHTVEQAAEFAERLRVAIAEHDMSADGGPEHVTVSIGAADWFAGMTGSGELLRAADEQLYRAKQEGRNAVRRTGTG
ncbi:MAG TPA: GGDEF domain-containing protein [Rhodanobacteraceae bacterium]|jgi:diguanylate cyclase (GGDEF)-like protein